MLTVLADDQKITALLGFLLDTNEQQNLTRIRCTVVSFEESNLDRPFNQEKNCNA